MLEANQYKDNNFVTLTYTDEHLPYDVPDIVDTLDPMPTLKVRDVQLFLKKLRKSLTDRKIRYFAVGEYGDQTQRPHYHLALFNYPSCRYGMSNHGRDGFCCSVCDHLRDVWDMGNVFSGVLEPDSAQYIAGYTTKKMTAKDDERLKGRHPEFARMSLKPGIGAGFIPDVASTLLEYNLENMEDVPRTLRHGPKEMPLGRYLRRQLRVQIGKPADTPQIVLKEMEAEMSPLFEAARARGPSKTFSQDVQTALINLSETSRRRSEFWHNLKQRTRTL